MWILSQLENSSSHSVAGSPAQLPAGAPRQRDGRGAQRRRRPRLGLQGPHRQHPHLQRPASASASEEILFMRTFKCITRPPVTREVVLQCTIQQHSWHKFLFLVVKISVEKIFLLNIEQWTNISLETRPRPQQPLTKCPGIEVTAKADLLCGNLKGCKVQDFPAQTCVNERREPRSALFLHTIKLFDVLPAEQSWNALHKY